MATETSTKGKVLTYVAYGAAGLALGAGIYYGIQYFGKPATVAAPAGEKLNASGTSMGFAAAKAKQFGNCTCANGSQCVGTDDCACCDKKPIKQYGNCTCRDGSQCVGSGDCACCDKKEIKKYGFMQPMKKSMVRSAVWG